MKNIIVGENIVKYYGKGSESNQVLDSVSVEIGEGEFTSIMGPSGSGKSTLLFALSGMDSVNSGNISFEGRNLASLKEDELADLRRTKMGFVFQQPTLLKSLNLLDNIILPSRRDSKKNAEEITQEARILMKKTGISELENRGITEVSGGQLQRAGICRALMSNPKIIFGDEPTGALNSTSAQEIMNIFSEINAEGTAVLLVTHDVRVAAQTERILFMGDGKIIRELRLPKLTSTDIESRMKKITEFMQVIGI